VAAIYITSLYAAVTFTLPSRPAFVIGDWPFLKTTLEMKALMVGGKDPQTKSASRAGLALRVGFSREMADPHFSGSMETLVMNSSAKKKNRFGFRAQAITEFAIALPVLLVMLVGIMEVGRMILTYALVTNASREAVRYASAFGLEDSGQYTKYKYCDGIKATARRSAYFVALTTINISYDRGPGTGPLVAGGCNAVGGEDADVAAVSPGDRVTVTITTTYRPVVRLIPINARTVTSSSSRTFLGIANIP
jgi:Flp pilus assembly protein TadG